MRTQRSLPRSLAATAVVVVALALGLRADKPGEFIPDATFTGSTLAGWRAVGDVTWKAQNGEIIGTPKAGGAGGWLIMEQSFEDVQLYMEYRCTGRRRAEGAPASLAEATAEAGQCQAGLMLRAERKPEGGMRGVYVSFTNGQIGPYMLTLDGQNKELARTRIVPPAASGAAPAPERTLAAGEWHTINVLLSGNNLRSWTTWSRKNGDNAALAEAALAEEDFDGFGPPALFVGGTGEVRFKDLAWRDLNGISEPKEETGSRYSAHRISSFYYGWSAAASDIDRDGDPDIVAGPFYFLGPDYTKRKIYRQGRVHNPATEYAPDMINLTADFTGDGWPDILSSSMGNGRPMDLHVNPNGESRRWDKFRVLPGITTEIVVLKDLDRDGSPEVLFGGGGVYAWARPDPGNPTAVWTSHAISVQGTPKEPFDRAGRTPPHGLGVGDVNGDGRSDVVVPFGWFEQPAAGITASPWTFHPAEYGENWVHGNGGGEMGVYDVNGDGLTDVVITQGHNWGINWCEQKRAADGTISFVTHPVSLNHATRNMGDVVFSGSHAAQFVDMNGDGILDMVTGKRYWGHLENYNGPDPYEPAVLYVYRTVRDRNAPGGARFEPQLVHNRSGVGSSFAVTDLNKDGVPDIAVSSAYGTHVFLSK